MKHRKGIILAAGLLAGAAAMTGCAAKVTPVATPTPEAAAKATAQPSAASPDVQATPQTTEGAAQEETDGPLALRVEGKTLDAPALVENDTLLLPLAQTARALGYDVREESAKEEERTKRSVEMSRGESRILVSWVLSDNTASRITWQKDGLLIPVDPMITTVQDVVYVPAAFFEEAAGARIARGETGVEISGKTPEATDKTPEQTP